MATNYLVNTFEHLTTMTNHEAALPLLQKIATLVKPIMKKREWKLPVLAEVGLCRRIAMVQIRALTFRRVDPVCKP